MRFWIRVNARLVDDAEVQAFAAAILAKQPLWLAVRATCGLLVALWGRVVDEQEDGNLTGRQDGILEEWAGWRGKAGLFAREFRARFVVDGHIREWTDYQGKLIERREKDRRRKRGGDSAGLPQETPQETPQDVGGNSAGIPRPHVNEHGQALVSAPYGAERQEPMPEPSPAPEGAAPSGTTSGNYQDSPSVRDALLKRGVRLEQIDNAPSGTLAELNAQQEWRRIEYDGELARSVAGWMAVNPDATEAIEADAWQSLGLRAGELSPLMQESLRGAVVEAIRQRADWPTLDTWDGCDFGTIAVHA